MSSADLSKHERERACYVSRRSELLRKHRGLYALISGDTIAGIYATATTAFSRGHDRFGAGNYVVIHLLENDDDTPVPFSVVQQEDRDRYFGEEPYYGSSCPACGIEDSLREYRYFLMAKHKARGAMEALASFTNPVNLVTTSACAVKQLVAWIGGAPRKECPQAICVACMAFAARCPYCSVVNRTPGKIQFEHTPMRCLSCRRTFDIKIYN
jgi:hypothetical protein